jgi:hypothetical protein
MIKDEQTHFYHSHKGRGALDSAEIAKAKKNKFLISFSFSKH